MAHTKLPLSFYRQTDVVALAQQLIGNVLCTRIDEAPLTSGIITETEAYCGHNDKASHAYGGRRTARTETMYQSGGIGYVYLCYGIHHLFNVVTNKADQADAVLIRAIKPVEGKERMLKRRKSEKVTPSLTAGPGRLTQALGITTHLDGIDLSGNTIWISDSEEALAKERIATSPRIGVDYAEEDANLPWRFYISNSKWVS